MKEEQIEEIETTLHHQNASIKELSESVSALQLYIYNLERKVDTLAERLKPLESSSTEDEPTRKPPHY
jgi:uncharacterized coiled-coil protein SlyX